MPNAATKPAAARRASTPAAKPTTTAPAAQPAPTAPGGPSPADRLRAQLAGTPGRLRLLAALTVGASLLLGVLGAATLNWRAGALSDAQAYTEQLVRLQTIRTRLVQADAEAANAFLVGGLEPAERRAAYVQSTEVASSTIAAAAGRSRADAEALAGVNQTLTRYTGLVEAARANNRQGLAVGSTYLQQASALLRAEILPRLTELADANQERVQDRYDASARHGWTFGLVAVLTLAALAAAQVWLARRTRRILNVGLAAGSALALLAVLIASWAMASSQSIANDAHVHAYAATVELAQARIDAFDAKSAESLTLVARGSGQAYEDEYVRVAKDATAMLAAARDAVAENAFAADSPEDAFDRYVRVHAEIRDADLGGDFAKAVKLATGPRVNEPFAEFDRGSDEALRTQSKAIVDELRRARGRLRPVAALLLLAGIVAAVAASRGISTRLQEYR
jgi:hypothetical protein